MSHNVLTKIKSLTSPRGHEIAVWDFITGEENAWLFILGCFHGDEPEGEFIIKKLMDELKAGSAEEVAYNLLLVPCLNPDGKELHTRENANKVDLNRNYPTANFSPESVNPHSGKASAGKPGSEMETKLMMELTALYEPARILSIHSDLHLVDYDGPAQEWAAAIAKLTGYKLVENVGYPCTGSFGTWAGIERQIPLVTLETRGAGCDDDFFQIWQEVRPALWATLSGKI